MVDIIGNVLASYVGDSPVFVQYEGKLYDLKFRVSPSQSLKAELADIVGYQNVKIM